jgi:PIN domain nuclease of toxin-antitoxin system
LKLLLDTHIWVWSISEPRKISRRVARALQDPRNELWVSPVSTLEMVLLCDKGRMQLEGGPEAWVQKVTALLPLREAPLTHEIALATRAIRLPHSDPADRLLAATALIHGLTLVTADRNLAGSKQISILWNR